MADRLKIGHAALLASLFMTPAAEWQAGAKAPPSAVKRYSRLLPLEGGQNFRDLGGYRTMDGRTVRWRLLYRSGSMYGLTQKDFAYLGRLGIRTVCDFRSTAERTRQPVSWPRGRAPRVLAEDYALDSNMGIAVPAREWTPAKAREIVAARYPDLLERFNDQYRRMFAELLAGHAPLAFNCSAGKDRTGVAAALLLTALGVPRETIVADYLLSDKYFDSKKTGGIDRGTGQWADLPEGVYDAFMAADRRYIEAIFKVMDRHPGGPSGYLRDRLNLTPTLIAKLRSLYTQ
ncbi:tyrosine-protein phosphatase [Sphingobium tyrosinilyticum]|uniref:Tyrosine-protein phosphatase n=1 Tax=Sphingobium tyrosinilyticum TaxID=2715436 RepID=A0ABV9F1U7_9SPHN